MISFRSIATQSRAGSKSENDSTGGLRTQALHQDGGGPLDGELLDLYVAILIVVPLAWLLRSLWS